MNRSGTVPDGWIKTTLEGYIDIKHGFAFKSQFFADKGNYVLMTPGSFFESGGFRDQGGKTKYYIGEIPSGYVLNKGDVLIAMTEQAAGLLGSAAYVPENKKYLHNQRLGLLNIKDPKKVCIEYLYLIYNSPVSRKQISEQSTGTKVKHTSPDKLRGIVSLVPPLLEQKKIAKILATWDRAIEVTEKLLNNSQQQKKSLMQQLLTGKKRLPGFSGEWANLSVNKFSALGKEKFDSKKAPIGRNCIELEHIEQKTARLLNSITTNNDMSTKSVFQKGDVLFGKLRPYLRKYFLASHGGVCSTEIWVLKPKKENVIPEFLFQLVQTEHFIDAANISSGTHMPRADWNIVRDIVFKIPLIEEQQKITSVLSIADKEIETLQQKLNHLKQEKKALMQQLLTGKRRVLL